MKLLRKNIATLGVLLMTFHVQSQEFSFEMYFEDALGNKDTLTFGYDATATNNLDPLFNEEDLSSVPWGSGFEVRISDHIYGTDQYNTLNYNFYTSTQIQEKSCVPSNYLISCIHVYEATYPISITWDSTLFDNPCRYNSLLTDWNPSGWFDAVFGNTQGVFLLRDMDSTSLNEPWHHNINANNDTTGIIYFTLANEDQVFVGIEEHDQTMNITPNPSTGVFFINGAQKPSTIIVCDSMGKEILRMNDSNEFDINKFEQGIYFVHLKYSDGSRRLEPILKI